LSTKQISIYRAILSKTEKENLESRLKVQLEDSLDPKLNGKNFLAGVEKTTGV
jgi:hypothetical protein